MSTVVVVDDVVVVGSDVSSCCMVLLNSYKFKINYFKPKNMTADGNYLHPWYLLGELGDTQKGLLSF